MSSTIAAASIQAEYVSRWDGGLEVVTACTVCTATGAVVAVPCESVEGLEVNEGELVRLQDGAEFEVDPDGETYMVADLAALQAHLSQSKPEASNANL